MICTRLSDTLGFDCHPLSEDGNIACLSNPFSFDDGAAVPLFVEKKGQMVRFFDDGGVLFHLRGRGMRLVDNRNIKILRSLTEPAGVSLTPSGEFEVWAKEEHAAKAFARYMQGLLALSTWEKEQRGVETDTAMFLQEVGLCLAAWRPNAVLESEPEFVGVSGHRYKLDFVLDDEAVLAVPLHPNAVSSAIKKILDIRALASNAEVKMLVVLDDRHHKDSAEREGLVIATVAPVLMMSRLEKNAHQKMA